MSTPPQLFAVDISPGTRDEYCARVYDELRALPPGHGVVITVHANRAVFGDDLQRARTDIAFRGVAVPTLHMDVGTTAATLCGHLPLQTILPTGFPDTQPRPERVALPDSAIRTGIKNTISAASCDLACDLVPGCRRTAVVTVVPDGRTDAQYDVGTFVVYHPDIAATVNVFNALRADDLLWAGTSRSDAAWLGQRTESGSRVPFEPTLVDDFRWVWMARWLGAPAADAAVYACVDEPSTILLGMTRTNAHIIRKLGIYAGLLGTAGRTGGVCLLPSAGIGSDGTQHVGVEWDWVGRITASWLDKSIVWNTQFGEAGATAQLSPTRFVITRTPAGTTTATHVVRRAGEDADYRLAAAGTILFAYSGYHPYDVTYQEVLYTLELIDDRPNEPVRLVIRVYARRDYTNPRPETVVGWPRDVAGVRCAHCLRNGCGARLAVLLMHEGAPATALAEVLRARDSTVYFSPDNAQVGYTNALLAAVHDDEPPPPKKQRAERLASGRAVRLVNTAWLPNLLPDPARLNVVVVHTFAQFRDTVAALLGDDGTDPDRRALENAVKTVRALTGPDAVAGGLRDAAEAASAQVAALKSTREARFWYDRNAVLPLLAGHEAI